jgi:hypothetical protein
MGSHKFFTLMLAWYSVILILDAHLARVTGVSHGSLTVIIDFLYLHLGCGQCLGVRRSD